MSAKKNSSMYWDKPWGLVQGCTPVSAACDHCWLAAMHTRFQHEWADGGPVAENGRFTGEISIREDRLDGKGTPLRTRKPTVWAIWSDLFHEKVPDEFLRYAYNVMSTAQRHTFLVLTKRPERMAKAWSHPPKEWPYKNVWHGTTVENQQTAYRLDDLVKVPGNLFVSYEPALGPLVVPPDILKRLKLVIAGGESGPGARPMHPDWVRSVRDQCEAAGVPFTFKQWGEWVPLCSYYEDDDSKRHDALYQKHNLLTFHGYSWNIDTDFQPPVNTWIVRRVGTKKACRLLDGREHNELPWRKQ